MEALIVDPGLRTVGGHHRNAALRLQAELAQLGVASRCLASAFAEPALVEAVGCRPTFSRSVYARSYDRPGEFAADVRTLRHELAAGERATGGAADLVVLPCCDQVLAAALAAQLGRRPLQRPPQVLLWLLYPPHFRRPDDAAYARAAERECHTAFARLSARLGPGRLTVRCETEGLARAYAGLGLEAAVQPGPGLVAARPRPEGRPGLHEGRPGRHGPPIVAVVGFANRAKGYRLLPAAVAALLADHADVEFRIQGITAGADAEDGPLVFERLAALGPRVALHQGVLAPADYEAWLDAADLLLLPYDPAVYRLRGSGVFSEAQRLGIPIVAPQGCGFAEPAFRDGWGVPMRTWDAAGVAEAVGRALADRARLDERARAAAGRTDDALPGLLAGLVEAARRPAAESPLARLRRAFSR